jgi:RNA polymerase sigma-70 factor, ECF subfamily
MDLIVQRARSGDAAAFEQLYRLHADWVYGLACAMLADETAARDATQEIFIKLWKSVANFRGESEFTTWLRRLAINHCLTAITAERRRHARVFATDDLAAFDPGVRPRTETAIDLERAISTLPANARAVFVLHDIEGYKHADIADMMGVAVGTVKSQLHRARGLLQKALD